MVEGFVLVESDRDEGYYLDLTALGRQEDWEEPKGRATDTRGAIPDFPA